MNWWLSGTSGLESGFHAKEHKRIFWGDENGIDLLKKTYLVM